MSDPPRARPPDGRALADPDALVRGAAVVALAALAAEPGSPLSESASQRAFWATVRHARRSGGEENLRHWATLAAVARALSLPGAARAAAIIDLAHGPDRPARIAALSAIGLDELADGAPLAEAATEDADPGVRRVALQALVRLRGPASLPLLVRAGSDPSPSVRIAALEGMATVGGEPGASALRDQAARGDWTHQLDLLAAARRLPPTLRRGVIQAITAVAVHPRVISALGEERDRPDRPPGGPTAP